MADVNMDGLSQTFKALSDQTRLQIVTLLLENDELCVCDFVGALDETQSKVSRHLRYLYNAGLVRDRRQGLWMHYRLSPDLSPQQRAIVEALARAVSEEQKQALRESLASWCERKGSPVCAPGAGDAGGGCC